jgi:glycogen operon protein
LWLTPQATEMVEQDWNFPEGRFLSYVLGPLEQGGAALYVVLNATLQTIEFTLPILPQYNLWTVLLETAPEPRLGAELASGAKLQARPRSILVFSGSP